MQTLRTAPFRITEMMLDEWHKYLDARRPKPRKQEGEGKDA